MKITLYGAASSRIGGEYLSKTEELGREIARRKHTLIFGAGATGVMGAAAIGANSEGGEIIGIAPEFMHEVEPLFKKCTKLIFTDTLSERKDLLENMADAFIIAPGGIGTLDEFFQILTLRNLERNEKKIVLFNIEHFWDDMISFLEKNMQDGFISRKVSTRFKVFDNPKDILDELEK